MTDRKASFKTKSLSSLSRSYGRGLPINTLKGSRGSSDAEHDDDIHHGRKERNGPLGSPSRLGKPSTGSSSPASNDLIPVSTPNRTRRLSSIKRSSINDQHSIIRDSDPEQTPQSSDMKLYKDTLGNSVKIDAIMSLPPMAELSIQSVKCSDSDEAIHSDNNNLKLCYYQYCLVFKRDNKVIDGMLLGRVYVREIIFAKDSPAFIIFHTKGNIFSRYVDFDQANKFKEELKKSRLFHTAGDEPLKKILEQLKSRSARASSKKMTTLSPQNMYDSPVRRTRGQTQKMNEINKSVSEREPFLIRERMRDDGNDSELEKLFNNGFDLSTDHDEGDDPNLQVITDPPETQIKFDPSLNYQFYDKSYMTITNSDFKCLYNNEWINDSLMDFFLKFNLEQSINQGFFKKEEIHVFTTFFFTKLAQSEDYYQNIKRWLSKIDLYKYRFIILPINENLHWYCTVISGLPHLLEPQSVEPGSPSPKKAEIFVFDSLHQDHSNIRKPIKTFLLDYALDKYKLEVDPKSIKFSTAYVPKQRNFNDCGIHVIYNVSKFLSVNEECLAIWKITDKRKASRKGVFDNTERKVLRKELREKLVALRDEQVKHDSIHKKEKDVLESDDDDLEIYDAVELKSEEQLKPPVIISHMSHRPALQRALENSDSSGSTVTSSVSIKNEDQEHKPEDEGITFKLKYNALSSPMREPEKDEVRISIKPEAETNPYSTLDPRKVGVLNEKNTKTKTSSPTAPTRTEDLRERRSKTSSPKGSKALQNGHSSDGSVLIISEPFEIKDVAEVDKFSSDLIQKVLSIFEDKSEETRRVKIMNEQMKKYFQADSLSKKNLLVMNLIFEEGIQYSTSEIQIGMKFLGKDIPVNDLTKLRERVVSFLQRLNNCSEVANGVQTKSKTKSDSEFVIKDMPLEDDAAESGVAELDSIDSDISDSQRYLASSVVVEGSGTDAHHVEDERNDSDTVVSLFGPDSDSDEEKEDDENVVLPDSVDDGEEMPPGTINIEVKTRLKHNGKKPIYSESKFMMNDMILSSENFSKTQKLKQQQKEVKEEYINVPDSSPLSSIRESGYVEDFESMSGSGNESDGLEEISSNFVEVPEEGVVVNVGSEEENYKEGMNKRRRLVRKNREGESRRRQREGDDTTE